MKENSIERLESIKEAHKSVKNDYSGIGGLIMSELVGGGGIKMMRKYSGYDTICPDVSTISTTKILQKLDDERNLK